MWEDKKITSWNILEKLEKKQQLKAFNTNLLDTSLNSPFIPKIHAQES